MITERLRKAAEQWPDRTACRIGRESITYRELWQQASETADLLRRQGTSPVIIRGDHGVWEITAVLACLLSKRAYVPVGSAVPEKRFSEIVRMTGSTLVITESAGGAGRYEGTAEVLTLPELSRFRGNKELNSDNETAYIIFTSGSTGTPKGVPVSYANLSNFARWIGALGPLAGYREQNVLNRAALGFDLSVADLYYSLCGGHTWTAVPGGLAAAEDMTGVFADGNIHFAVLTPSALKMCLIEETFTKESLPELKAIFCCGERLEKKPVRKLFARFPEICLINAYGPTEATCAVCAVRITPEMAEADEELPVGEIPSAATDVTVRDGEIVLTGPSVFSGYLDGRAGGHFLENGVNGYRTGDGGYIRDGLLYYTGRNDSQVKYKGYRIELDEIECAVNRIAGVAECAVIAKRNPEGIVKTIQAFAVPEKGSACTPESIKRELSEMLPAYMIPKTVAVTDSLPRNANGKTDRKALERI
ncbi:MAG: AMP-binding protein [Lachnospiraceae bacterium]|nr:AMP-binding protein [Lachnospiraceae bacterium]